jgi:hypothetical protein
VPVAQQLALQELKARTPCPWSKLQHQHILRHEHGVEQSKNQKPGIKNIK